MLVKDYMTRHPLMAGPEMSIIDAQKFMGENNVRHLPVVGDGKRLLGLVTRQTLLVDPSRLGSLSVWDIARTLSSLTVKDVMLKAAQVITVSLDETIEDAACIMVEKRIGCLPVVEDGVLVGIITEVDLLAHLTELMAMNRRGTRITIRMPDVPGELAKLVAAIAARGWGIPALGGAPSPKAPGKWDAVVKLGVSRDEALAALGNIPGQEIVDIRDA